MEDCGAAIAAGEDVIEPAGEIASWLAGHWGEVAVGVVISRYACLTPILIFRRLLSKILRGSVL
jgi:hypothetical protein